MKSDLTALGEVAKVVARDAGIFLGTASKDVLLSSGKDIKIKADIETNKLIRDQLASTGIPVLAEEDTIKDFSLPRMWVVDPLDGSLNFNRGLPLSAVSIALLDHNEPVLGVVYDFHHNDLYFGLPGMGAWCNDREIKVSERTEKSSAILMTGFPSHTDHTTDALMAYVGKVQEFKKVRLIGSAALSLAYVASGRADAYYEKDIYLWDVAAGLALVKAAGGVTLITDRDALGRCTVTANNGHILG